MGALRGHGGVAARSEKERERDTQVMRCLAVMVVFGTAVAFLPCQLTLMRRWLASHIASCLEPVFDYGLLQNV